MSQYAEKWALYRFDYQQVIKGLLKGRLLHFKRAPFTMQKMPFYIAKGRLLQCKRACIALPSVIYFYNSWYPLVG